MSRDRLHLPDDVLLNEAVVPIHTHDDAKAHLLSPDGSRYVGSPGLRTAAQYLEPVVEYAPECEELRTMRAIDRRSVLKGIGVGSVLLAADFNRYSFTPAAAESTTANIVVAVFLRGGMDGLGAVIPLDDANYQRLRPRLGLTESTLSQLPGTQFALHPALKQLNRLYVEGSLGIIHATGHIDQSRSHFAKQQFHESGATEASMRSGWLGRYLATSPGGSVFRALTVGSAAAFMMAHENPTLAMSRLGDFAISAPTSEIKRQIFDNVRALWGSTGGLGEDAMDFTIQAALHADALATQPSVSAYPSTPVATRFKELAGIIKANVGLEVACVDVDGWDMHTDMGTQGGGLLYAALKDLDAALGAFWDDLGPRWQGRVTVLTMSEFGRTGATNGDNGTDHGYGNVMFVLGGRSGVHGQWPGLNKSALVDGDLDIANDYRNVVAELMTKKLGVNDAQLHQILPNFSPRPLGVF